jgi:LPS export ABC transporter protein LptC
MKKRYLLSLVVLSGITFSYFYEPNIHTFTSDTLPQSTPLSFYLKKLETRSFNQLGQHTNTLSSIYAYQRANNKSIYFDLPEMQIALQSAPWIAHATNGLSSENQKRITLSDSVVLSRFDGIADVSTETLVFDSKDEVAYTESAVEILARGSKTQADGVHIDLNNEVIHLRNNVKTYYVPENTRRHRHKP